jgi:Lon protease-like protein
MFPLGTVLLPSVALPLHVFEERYRALVEDCIEGDNRFGVVLIERGSEVGGGDVRTDVGTVAQIVEAARFDDGRYALVAVGRERVRVARWLDDAPYPRAEVEVWPDAEPEPGLEGPLGEAVALLRRVLARRAEAGDDVAPATSDLTDDVVLATYQAVALAPLGPADRQRLLAAPTPGQRIRDLTALLEDELGALDRMLELDSPGDDGPEGWEDGEV